MYDNIQKALNQKPQGGLSYEEQSKNYAIFSDLMKKGVKLQDLIDRANAPREPPVDTEVFSVMEAAVADRPEVKAAKAGVSATLKKVMERMAERDPEYQKTVKAYRDAVMKAYTENKGTPAAEMTKCVAGEGEQPVQR